MSDVRYAFSDPCGMAMIIMVIIQHLNSSLSLRASLQSTSALGPGVDVYFATTYFSTLVRDIGGDRESNAEVPGLQFNCGKFGGGGKSCCTLYTLSIPSPFSLLLSLAPLSIKEIGLKVEQISVIFISQLGEGWLRPGLSSLYGFSPSFCFPTVLCASFYALTIF